MIKSILNNPYIVAIVSGVAILIISYIFFNKNKKVLSYKIIYNNLLIKNSEKIKISYSDKEINNIYNVAIEINNIGNNEIKPEDYNKNISIIFDEDVNILSAVIKEKYPDDLDISFEKDGNKVFLDKILLNKKEKFTIQFELTSKNNLVKEKLDKIQISARIAGFEIIEKKQVSFLSFLPNLYITVILLIALILFSSIYYLIKSTVNDLSSSTITTKYITIPLTTPPERYEVGTITNNQQALLEYQKALMRISRWQNWYNTQVGSNYYHYTTNEINNFYSNKQLE